MDRKGVLYALASYLCWGLFPLYWKQLTGVDSVQIIGHRIVWSFVFLAMIILATRQFSAFRKSLNRRNLQLYALAAVLISLNWLTYVWAVTNGRVIESSLGYFVNPLVSVVLGVIFFKERLRPAQWMPIGLAAVGVAYLAFSYGQMPWISIALAMTFGLYGAIKKTAPLGSLFGLAFETGILFLPAAAFLGYAAWIGTGAFLQSATATQDLAMVGGGIVTSVPLLLFAAAATRVPLSTIGVLQYINPTIQLALGVLLYHEDLHGRLPGFILVWLALIIFWAEGLYRRYSSPGAPLPELGEG